MLFQNLSCSELVHISLIFQPGYFKILNIYVKKLKGEHKGMMTWLVSHVAGVAPKAAQGGARQEASQAYMGLNLPYRQFYCCLVSGLTIYPTLVCTFCLTMPLAVREDGAWARTAELYNWWTQMKLLDLQEIVRKFMGKLTLWEYAKCIFRRYATIMI